MNVTGDRKRNHDLFDLGSGYLASHASSSPHQSKRARTQSSTEASDLAFAMRLQQSFDLENSAWDAAAAASNHAMPKTTSFSGAGKTSSFDDLMRAPLPSDDDDEFFGSRSLSAPQQQQDPFNSSNQSTTTTTVAAAAAAAPAAGHDTNIFDNPGPLEEKKDPEIIEILEDDDRKPAAKIACKAPPEVINVDSPDREDRKPAAAKKRRKKDPPAASFIVLDMGEEEEPQSHCGQGVARAAKSSHLSDQYPEPSNGVFGSPMALLDDEVDAVLNQQMEQQVDEAFREQNDEKMAKDLQEQFDQEHKLAAEERKQRQEEHEKAMASSHTGKAFTLVEKVIALCTSFVKDLPPEQANNIDTIGKDDMVFLAEKLLEQQEQFREAGIACRVDIGFHYTRETNLDTIRTGGLLSKAERQTNNIQSNYNGSAYGDGIYTADDSISSFGYGNVGLIVVRLPGLQEAHSPSSRTRNSPWHGKHGNSVICNAGNWMVLQKSSQVLALVRFKSDLGNFFAPEDSANAGYNSHARLTMGPFGTGVAGSHSQHQFNKEEEQHLRSLPSKLAALVDETINAGMPADPPMPPDIQRLRSARATSAPGSIPVLSHNAFPANSGHLSRRSNSRRVVQMPSGPTPLTSTLSRLPTMFAAPPQTNPIQAAAAPAPAAMNSTFPLSTAQQASTPLTSTLSRLPTMFTAPSHSSATSGSFATTSGVTGLPPHFSASSNMAQASASSAQQSARRTMKNAPATAAASTVQSNHHAPVMNNPLRPKGTMTQAAKDALARAVKSAIKDPNGQVAPNLMLDALRTGLSRHAVLKAVRLYQQKHAAKPPPPGSTGAMTVAGSTFLSRCIRYSAPESLNANNSSLFYKKTGHTDEECPICFENDGVSFQVLKKCSHFFCLRCLQESLKKTKQCPCCRIQLGGPAGPQPSGKMTISSLTGPRSGFIELKYSFRGGVQKQYHPQPGMSYSGIVHTAYLQDTPEGRRVLSRLEYAFSIGLTFQIDSNNALTWHSIPHKTAITGGSAHSGYPDPRYIKNVNDELDSLGVPRLPSM